MTDELKTCEKGHVSMAVYITVCFDPFEIVTVSFDGELAVKTKNILQEKSGREMFVIQTYTDSFNEKWLRKENKI